MENSNKRRWQVRAGVLGIFLLGFLAGALVLNLYQGRRRASAGRDQYEQMIDRLNLTPDQRAQVNQIMKETRAQIVEVRRQSEPRINEIRQQTDERMKAALTPDQWSQWQQATSAMRERRRWGRAP
jgi:Spy/CpxP family protein refolding chaperone